MPDSNVTDQPDLMKALADSLRPPDLSLDDEREDHVDHGQVQVEPGQAWAEACELPHCASDPEAAT